MCALRRQSIRSHTFGRTPARKSVGTHLLRVGAIMMAVPQPNADCQCVLPFTRALVSSLAITAGGDLLCYRTELGDYFTRE